MDDTLADEYPLGAHILRALRENPDTCISLSLAAGNHPYIRYHDGRWEFVLHMEYDWYAAGYIEADQLAHLVENNPFSFVENDEAYPLSSGPSYWELAEENDLFREDLPLSKHAISQREDELAPWASGEELTGVSG